ncbi:MAG: hypothetical protein KJO66_07395 [Gammaproteobacteria bacterium]|nr:hypothetical protein [Gammaproteobacteria bacterium]
MPFEVLIFLTQIMSCVCVLALLWLAARAFRKNLAWGFGVLLLSPIGAAAFGIRHWHHEKLPFLGYVTTFAVTAGLLLSLFSTWGGWELVDATRNAKLALHNQTLTRSDADAFRKASVSFAKKSGIPYQDESLLKRMQHEFDRKAEHAQIDAQVQAMEEREALQEEKEYTLEDLYRRTPKKRERYRLSYKNIRVSDAHRYIGATVKVTRRNVLEKEYRLTGIKGDSLKFAQKNRSGSFSFAFHKRDIEKIRVLIKEPY